MIAPWLRALERLRRAIASRARNIYYRLLGVQMSGYAWLRAVEAPRQHRRIVLGAGCSLDKGVTLLVNGAESDPPAIRIGRGVYINRHTIIDAVENVTIGDDCAIGPGCYLTDHDHGFDGNLKPLQLPFIVAPTTIGRRVWIGAHAVILKGVCVGDGAVIGAGSVVTKAVPPGVVVVGVPAQVIRQAETHLAAV